MMNINNAVRCHDEWEVIDYECGKMAATADPWNVANRRCQELGAELVTLRKEEFTISIRNLMISKGNALPIFSK